MTFELRHEKWESDRYGRRVEKEDYSQKQGQVQRPRDGAEMDMEEQGERSVSWMWGVREREGWRGREGNPVPHNEFDFSSSDQFEVVKGFKKVKDGIWYTIFLKKELTCSVEKGIEKGKNEVKGASLAVQ